MALVKIVSVAKDRRLAMRRARSGICGVSAKFTQIRAGVV
ncbi:MAG: hypothetical protein QOE02_3417 [Rhodospirillaceae bacterium]|jgi:hypothetical protein|nr:hypothetical protein [Rhodospirillaceae bacterium]MEA2853398.1 hypothetical protein [Rhodospirillaceae bacterium]